MKVAVVLGTRPEAIKLAPVVAALRRRSGLKTVVVSTGQHRELLSSALAAFRLKPDRDLKLMRPGQSPAEFTRRALAALKPLLVREKPGLVVVQGDTATALAGALAAVELGIAIAHVEAGLRSFDHRDPFPEEVNRVVIDHASTLLFPPTAQARRNLLREGLRPLPPTGNTVVDALRSVAGKGRAPVAGERREVLVTLHRRESFGAPLEGMLRALRALVERRPNLLLLFPVHPNPRVRSAARRLLRHPRVARTAPLPYADLAAALARVAFVVTDSGGLQEEAAALGVPVLIARDKTERPELVAAGGGVVAGRGPGLARWAERLLDEPSLRRRMSRAKNPFGDGRAAERVADAIARFSRR